MNPPTMRAATIHQYGGPEQFQIEDVPLPDPGPGEVRIRIHATSVNPVDLGTRAGRNIPEPDERFPMIVGWDVAGTVDAVGEGVTRWAAGDDVIGMSVHPVTQRGTYAEAIVLAASDLAAQPTNVPAEHAATLPLAGLTALQSVEALALNEGETVLINGPLGAVGGFAAQLAARQGARVLAPVHEHEADVARRLGVHDVLDRDGDWSREARERAGSGVDAALDVVGSEAAQDAFRSLRDAGRYATVVPEWWIPGGPFEPHRGIDPFVVGVRADGTQLAHLAEMVEAGTLTTRVAQTLDLSEAGKAHQLLAEGGMRGKLVLTP